MKSLALSLLFAAPALGARPHAIKQPPLKGGPVKKIVESALKAKKEIPLEQAGSPLDESANMYITSFSGYDCKDEGIEISVYYSDNSFIGPMGGCLLKGSQTNPDKQSPTMYKCNSTLLVQLNYAPGDDTCSGEPISAYQVQALTNGEACVNSNYYDDDYDDDDDTQTSDKWVCTSGDPLVESGADVKYTVYEAPYPSYSYLYIDPTYDCQSYPKIVERGLYADSQYSECMDYSYGYGSQDSNLCEVEGNRTVSVDYYTTSNCEGAPYDSIRFDTGCVNGIATYECAHKD